MRDTERLLNSCSAVEVRNACLRFKKQTVLQGLDLKVEGGIIYGLLGPSGCGKSTLLKCIVGRIKLNRGIIKIYGKNPGEKGSCVPGSGVGFMPQESALHTELTIEETLMYFGRIYQMSEKNIKTRISFLTEFLELADKTRLIKHLSGGQQRRVSFAAAVIHEPPLIILDEPTVGVDPLLRRRIWNFLQKLAAVDFLTIILTTHYIEEARQAQIVGLMREGRLLAEDNPEQLLRHYNALTLEDVFLKLCEQDMRYVDEQQWPESFENKERERTLNTENSEIASTKQQSQPQYHSAYIPITSSAQKMSLFNDPLDPESVYNSKMNLQSVRILKGSSLRIAALITRNFIRFKRMIPLLLFQIFIPMLQIILYYLCIGSEPFDLPLVVVNMEKAPLGKAHILLEHLNPKIIRQVPFTNLSPAIESVKRGENFGVLYIGPSFTVSLVNRMVEGIAATTESIEESTITLHLDMTSPLIVMRLHTEISESIQKFAKEVLEDFHQNPHIADYYLKIGKPIYGHDKFDFTEFTAPGMILAIIFIMAVGVSANSIILEKKSGLLDRSWITGVQDWEVLLSLTLCIFLILLFQLLLVFLCSCFIFHLSCVGSMVWVVFCVLLTGLLGMSYGLLISSITNDENIAVMIAMATFVSNLCVSGLIWPIETMPHYLRYISYCLPLTLLCSTIRSVLFRGWSITDFGIWNGCVVAIAYTIAAIIISNIIFKYWK